MAAIGPAQAEATLVPVTIRVRHGGIGIAPEALEGLGRRFAQADASTTRGFGGTGLGLAPCRSLASAMRGEIERASEPEKGGIVAASLGVAPQPEGAAVEDGRMGRRPSPAEPPGAVNALLVDGNEIGREAIAALLRRVGATVETPADGREGVSKATCATFDLLLMDLQMPLLDGFKGRPAQPCLARELVGDADPCLTAHALREDVRRSIAAGMDIRLTKPVPAPPHAALVSERSGEGVKAIVPGKRLGRRPLPPNEPPAGGHATMLAFCVAPRHVARVPRARRDRGGARVTASGRARPFA